MSSSSYRFEELREIEQRQQAEAARRQQEEQGRQQLDVARAAYDTLRAIETQQREATGKAQQAAKEIADKETAAKTQQAVEAERGKVAEANAEQERQYKAVEQLAARSWKMERDASGLAAARADIQELHNREMRRSEEERRTIEKSHPGDWQKLERYDQFADRKLEAIRFPDPHLQGKTAEQIKEIAQQALREELAREKSQPARVQGQTLDHQAAKSRDGQKPTQDLTVAHEARVTAHNREVRTAQPARQQGNERAQLQPETARTDMRGFDRGDGRTTDRPASRGEITDRKAAQQNDNARPRTDRQARAEAGRALAAQRGQDRERGDDDGGRGRGR